jgi:hypothetical protein
METDFLVTGYSKLLHERSAQGEGEANHIASRLSNSFVPASEASCGRLYWGHSCRSWHALRTSVDRRDQWAIYRVLDALFIARGNRNWRRRSSCCMASVRGTACSGDNLARGELGTRRADPSTTRATFSWEGLAKIFHKRVRIYPRHTECEVADTRASYSNQSLSFLVNGGHGVDGAKRSHRAEISS